VRSLSVENDALREEMKALQRACTALSKENGKLEVSDTPAVFEPCRAPFLFRAHVASRPPLYMLRAFDMGTKWAILLGVAHIKEKKREKKIVHLQLV